MQEIMNKAYAELSSDKERGYASDAIARFVEETKERNIKYVTPEGEETPIEWLNLPITYIRWRIFWQLFKNGGTLKDTLV